MSQAGIVDFEGSHPQVPTTFVTNMGSATPIANTLEILGTAVAAHSIPVQTTGSGNTVTIQVQYASAAGTSVATNAGLASFSSADFTVDANGFVVLTSSAGASHIEVDTSTPPGTNPVIPSGAGIITVTGGQVAAGTTANVIQTNSLAANTYTIQIQRSQAVASSTIGDNGVSHFNNTYFTVDGNGFVSINGSHVGETITGSIGGALSPTAGNWGIVGASTAAGTTPVQTSGSGSTLTVQVQKAQAIASTNATNVGLAAFSSSQFAVDANGFVTLSGTGVGETITGNTGGALSPTAGNWNIVGTGSLTSAGSGSTLTFSLTGLTAHNILLGEGTATVGLVAPTANTGAVLQNNASADPTYSTATYPSTTAQGDLLLSSAANTITTLAKDTNATRYLSNTGTSNNAAWAQVALTTGVTGILPIANGGSDASSFGTTHGVVVYDGTRLVNYAGPQISTAGISTNTTQPAFLAYSASGVTNQTGDGTLITVVLDTVFFDNGSNFNTSTHEFTAPVTGRYFLTASISRRAAGTSTTMGMYIGTTLQNYGNFGSMNSNANGDSNITMSVLAPMTAGDVAFVNFQVSGGTKNVGYWPYSSASETNTTFSGFLVC